MQRSGLKKGIVFWRKSGPERAKSHILVLNRATGSQPHPYFWKYSPLGIHLNPSQRDENKKTSRSVTTYASHVLFKHVPSSMEIT